MHNGHIGLAFYPTTIYRVSLVNIKLKEGKM